MKRQNGLPHPLAPTLCVQANSCCCLSFFTSPRRKRLTCTVPGINVNQFWPEQDEAGSSLLARTVFSLCSLKVVLLPPNYNCKLIVWQSRTDTFFFSLGISKHPCFLIKYIQ